MLSDSGSQMTLGGWAEAVVEPPKQARRKPRDRRPKRVEHHQAEIQGVIPWPGIRANCVNEMAIRPCPFVRCKHHLLLEVTPAASLRMHGNEERFLPHDAGADAVDRWTTEAADHLFEMPETCVLDVAGDENRAGKTLSVRAIAPLIGLHFSKVAVAEQEARAHMLAMDDDGDDGVADLGEAWDAVAEMNGRKF